MENKNTLRDEMLNKIVKEIKSGTPRWRRGWAVSGLPYNMKSKNIYNGINLLSLAFDELSEIDPRWATFKQINEMGAKVKKGEKGQPVEFFLLYDFKTKKSFTEDSIKHLDTIAYAEYKNKYVKAIIKYSTVFNASQVEGIEPFFKKTFDLNEIEQLLLNNKDIKIDFKGRGKAFYSPKKDSISLPNLSTFKSKEDFFSTLLHELSHSTGHEKRLNRDMTGTFGDDSYAMEELIAELSTVFLLMELGLEIDPNSSVFTNNASYLSSWAKKLEEKEESLYQVSKLAYESADYIKNLFNDLKNETIEKKCISSKKRA